MEKNKNGQALVEFVVGLIAVISILACLRIGSAMITAHSEAMMTARSKAAETASLEASLLSDAKYIKEATAGQDQRQYTKDDGQTAGNGIELSDIVVSKTVSADSDWDTMQQIPDNQLLMLRGNYNPSASFGLVNGNDKKTVPISLAPAVRFFYNADSIEVECNVWMTQLNGIY